MRGVPDNGLNASRSRVVARFEKCAGHAPSQTSWAREHNCGTINARARATTIESARDSSDIAHANTGNVEDIWRSCSKPRSSGGTGATSGTSDRISHSVSSMATNHSSPRKGGQNTTTYQDKPQPLHDTLLENIPATASLRLPAGRQQLPGSGDPIFA